MIRDTGTNQPLSALDTWLTKLEKQHPNAIDLGLDRVKTVAQRAGLDQLDSFIITIAGTNGKGSSVEMLQSILLAAGYSVGAYTSPHLLHFNERITLNRQPVSDEEICSAFAWIEAQRHNISLTYFEFATLAAAYIFKQQSCQVVLLEVGLGGRLDAVNIYDADIALITSIGLDHTEWLGDSRELIGREKAGIARAGKPLICADPNPPATIAKVAEETSALLMLAGHDFCYEMRPDGGWSWSSLRQTFTNLSELTLPGQHQYQNAAGVLQVICAMAEMLPVSEAAIRQGLVNTTISGRLQVIPGVFDTLLDVAHNQDSVQQLGTFLHDYNQKRKGRVLAVFSALSDKDINALVSPVHAYVDQWFLAPLKSQRAMPLETLSNGIEAVVQAQARDKIPSRPLVISCDTIAQAWSKACSDACAGDLVVVYGSFITVAEVLKLAL